MVWTKTLFTFCIGLIGAQIARKIKLPSGYMIGAMLAVAIFSITTGEAEYPTFMKNFTQTISGTFIGVGIKKEDLSLLREMVMPAVSNVVTLIGYSLLMAWFLYNITDFSFATAAFATAPGGIVDMTVISMDMGADTAVVSVLQTLRLFSVIAFFPGMFSLILNNKQETSPFENDIVTEEGKKKNLWLTALIGGVGGFIGYLIKIPAGPLIGSMFMVGVQNVTTKSAVMPIKVKFLAQISAGVLIGSSINAVAFFSLRVIFLPAVIMITGYIILALVMGVFLFKTSQLSLSTALFASAPGGASDLALMSIDYNANSAIVSLMQTIRIVSVITFYPIVISLVDSLINK